MKPELKIFIADHCPSCTEARHTARRIQQEYPRIEVKVVDIEDAHVVIPDVVFATPTYVLNNRVVSLGNPSRDDIASWMAEVPVS